jgi:hypothetical protein
MCHHNVREQVTHTEAEREEPADDEEEADAAPETPVADD